MAPMCASVRRFGVPNASYRGIGVSESAKRRNLDFQGPREVHRVSRLYVADQDVLDQAVHTLQASRRKVLWHCGVLTSFTPYLWKPLPSQSAIARVEKGAPGEEDLVVLASGVTYKVLSEGEGDPLETGSLVVPNKVCKRSFPLAFCRIYHHIRPRASHLHTSFLADTSVYDAAWLLVAHIRGTLKDGTMFIDSIVMGAPVIWEVGIVGQYNPEGLEEAVSTMRKGGHRIIYVPPELGYGTEGAKLPQGRVPPGAALEYDVQVLRCESRKGIGFTCCPENMFPCPPFQLIDNRKPGDPERPPVKLSRPLP